MRTVVSSLLILFAALILYSLDTTTITQSLRSLARRGFSLHKQQPSLFRGNLPFSPPSLFAPRDTARNMTVPRKIAKAFLAIEQSEGAGARVRRSIGTPKARNFSPFLMLDHATVHPGSGFPDHPHRGQETITYVLEGAIDHEDFAGNSGTIYAGDLQFMTAGRGIVHSEIPNPNYGTNVGMQLWVDLPEKLKSCEPRYRDLRAAEIPSVTADEGRVTVKVISGRSQGVDSVQELAYTPVWMFDVAMQPHATFHQPLPEGWNAFAYTLEGSASFGAGQDATSIAKYHNVLFEQAGDEVVVTTAAEPVRFLLIAGLPLDQNVVQYGPFVVTSKEQVYQALKDYQTYSNGFERAENWQSEIGKSMVH